MRRALRPLVRLDRAAAEIGRTGDTRRRLPDPRRDDEVGRLAATLNAMLDSLERARESERRFLADASHELRTPLTALRGNVDVPRAPRRDAALLADLQATRSGSHGSPTSCSRFRARRRRRRPSEVRLDELAREARTVEVVAASRCVVRGDRDALERALANLVENARRHGRGGGSRSRVESDGRARRLSVADEGPGVRRPGARAGVRAVLARRHGAARASGSRSCAPPPSGTAVVPSWRARASRSSCPLSESFRVRRLHRRRGSEKGSP